ncbi:MAG: hypothetical protein LBU96_07065 [Yokenella regensburgei]|nr:hypothetical protein [Yokenella regensburgei]
MKRALRAIDDAATALRHARPARLKVVWILTGRLVSLMMLKEKSAGPYETSRTKRSPG